MLCEYGCGEIAKFKMTSGKMCCAEHYCSCPALKKRNSEGVKTAHINGKIPGWKELRENYGVVPPLWNKGKFNADFTMGGKKGPHKKILIGERGHCCEICKNTEWLGKPIALELEHIDGDNRNHVKDNLKLLCPNCHSQIDTYRGKNINKSRKYVTDEEFIEALQSTSSIHAALLKLHLTPKAANYVRAYDLLYARVME